MIPTDTKRWTNAGLMLARRRRANIKPAFTAFTGISICGLLSARHNGGNNLWPNSRATRVSVCHGLCRSGLISLKSRFYGIFEQRQAGHIHTGSGAGHFATNTAPALCPNCGWKINSDHLLGSVVCCAVMSIRRIYTLSSTWHFQRVFSTSKAVDA